MLQGPVNGQAAQNPRANRQAAATIEDRAKKKPARIDPNRSFPRAPGTAPVSECALRSPPKTHEALIRLASSPGSNMLWIIAREAPIRKSRTMNFRDCDGIATAIRRLLGVQGHTRLSRHSAQAATACACRRKRWLGSLPGRRPSRSCAKAKATSRMPARVAAVVSVQSKTSRCA